MKHMRGQLCLATQERATVGSHQQTGSREDATAPQEEQKEKKDVKDR